MSWKEFFNSADLPAGSFRSIAGYAAESLVIGRAMQCGYNLFFKAWRDSPYDGVLDHNGILFRIEIKGTTTDSLGVTSGGRAGAQISREAEDRTHLIDLDTVDIVLGINNLNADCYIIHTEIIQIFAQQSLSLEKIEIFKEKWKVFKGFSSGNVQITTSDIRNGFLRRSESELVQICRSLNIVLPEKRKNLDIEWPGFRGGKLADLEFKEYLTLKIWCSILK